MAFYECFNLVSVMIKEICNPVSLVKRIEVGEGEEAAGQARGGEDRVTFTKQGNYDITMQQLRTCDNVFSTLFLIVLSAVH